MEPFKVIWSLGHGGPLNFDYAQRIIDAGAELGVDGVEIAYPVEKLVTYREMPDLCAGGDTEEIEERQRVVQRIAEYATSRGLRTGVWLHEISGPPGLLELMPEMRAQDGLIDLESPLIDELISAQLDEFFEAAPDVDEVVLTLTESQICALHRPFCSMPLAERALRIIKPVVESARYFEKGVVARTFSVLIEDERAVLDAVAKVGYEDLSVMMKSDLSNWSPFLPNHPLMRKVGAHELRAEADAGAEHYGGQAAPVIYARHIIERLEGAADRGATTITLRVDRRGQPALGTLNEINLLAATAWAKNPELDVDAFMAGWLKERLGAAPDGLAEMLDQTFEVWKNALYIDGQQMSHDRFPSFDDAKHVQMFGLFEPAEHLRHMRENWAVLSDRPTLPHGEIVRGKEEAVEMAEALEGWFQSLAHDLRPEARDEAARSLARLTLVARASLALTRLVAAHLEDAWGMEERAVGAFEEEAAAAESLAAEVAAREGGAFFGGVADRLKDFAARLRAERAFEMERRRDLSLEPGLVDYVLCGLASEGHKLGKRLHTGATRADEAARYRETGVGDCEGFGYEVKLPPGQACWLEVDLCGSGERVEGVAWIGSKRFALRGGGAEGEIETLRLHVPQGTAESPARVEIFSTTPRPVRVSEIRILRAE